VVELAAETEMVMAGTDQGSGSGRWKRKWTNGLENGSGYSLTGRKALSKPAPLIIVMKNACCSNYGW
jgi:biotin-(acetyl-CoA carboxylase) ligase